MRFHRNQTDHGKETRTIGILNGDNIHYQMDKIFHLEFMWILNNSRFTLPREENLMKDITIENSTLVDHECLRTGIGGKIVHGGRQTTLVQITLIFNRGGTSRAVQSFVIRM